MDVACGGSVPEGYPREKNQYDQAAQVLDDALTHTATIATSCGDITVELYSQEAPRTANNFAFLASEGFYDATIIHRVVPGFVVQMGDPTGTGTGGPGYRFPDELGAAQQRGYARGTVAMANAGPDTNGSQFFIVTTEAAPWLDGKHTVFGRVASGMEAVDAIEGVATGPGDMPEEPVVIERVETGTPA